MSKESFIRIPPGMDCRPIGQRTPIPVSWKKTGGMTFGNDWQGKDWRKDRESNR